MSEDRFLASDAGGDSPRRLPETPFRTLAMRYVLGPLISPFRAVAFDTAFIQRIDTYYNNRS